MKLRVVGVNGLCDARIVNEYLREGNSSRLLTQVRIQMPDGEYVYTGPEAFRQRCTVAWSGRGELEQLQDLKFLD